MSFFKSGAASKRRIASGFSSLGLLLAVAAFCCLGAPPAAASDGDGGVRLSGHVLPALARSPDIAAKSSESTADSQPLTLTVVLRRSDEQGFQRFLTDVYDPASAQFRRFSDPQALATRFGPGPDDYALVRDYFTGQGFSVAEDSANRMTLTLRGTRGLAASALSVHIRDYRIGDRSFYANDGDPALPADVAARVAAIAGLSDLAAAEPVREIHIIVFSTVCMLTALFDFDHLMAAQGSAAAQAAYLKALAKCINSNGMAAGYGKLIGIDPPPPAWQGVDGTGQTVGLLEFDNFLRSDVVDYIELIGLPAGQIDKISTVNVGGGTAPGANQDEVLLDIADVLSIAPGADIKVYDAPFAGGSSFQALFNAMINGGVTVISNSWAYCEDQTSLADVQSIDSILQSAAASGISVFSGSGDSGSTCLDGGANTIAVPAGAPHLTAVGGTSLALGPGYTYESETWWNGSGDTPQTGQGGFGVSRFFARPAYQNGFNASSMRSIPDVSANADPASGVQICAAALGGCPTGGLYGGTSSSTPIWAAFTALLNQAQGQNLGALNTAIYPLGATDAFHDSASMGSDFAHVGLGSPNLARLHQRLTNQSFGTVASTVSEVHAYGEGNFTFSPDLPVYVDADGTSRGYVAVRVADANGNVGGGIAVSLTAGAGNSAVISPPSGNTDVDTGTIVFAITDTTPEALTFTATAGGTPLAQTPQIAFVSPPAAAASIMAFPTTVPADGVSATSITVTLHDADNRPSPGKHITVSQDGRSVVLAPDPPVTDANGQIVFTATDGIEETVTYTAVDDTDAGLPVPGSAVVTFSGSAVGSCAGPATPASADYTVTPFVNGFAAYPFFYGNVNWGCRGAGSPAFSANGDVFVPHFPTGDLYKFGRDGGAATAPLSNLGPTLDNLVFGLDGRLYATHGATTGDFTTGNIIEIDPDTGAQLRVVASGATCPNGMAVDPLSGDLFFTDPCFGAGADNPALSRVSDPAGANPQVTVYASLPSTPNGVVAFAPDGTIYAGTAYGSTPSPVYSITGTDQPSPPIVAAVADVTSFYWVNVADTLPSGAAHSLFALGLAPNPPHAQLNLVDITTSPATITPVALDIGCATIAADGCLYSSTPDTVYKIAPASGNCSFTGTSRAPSLVLTPASVSPNPDQGTTQTLMAVFRNVDLPAGTPVYFRIDGANAQTHLVRTDAGGIAALDYQGTFAGVDMITASATVDSMTLMSNRTRITWDAGKHATFIALPGPVGAVSGQPVALAASLVDLAVDPQAAIAGAVVHFAVGGQSCDATTGANGVASCSVTLVNAGAYTLTASYAGSTQYLPSTASTVFVIPTDNVDLIFADGFEGN